MKVSLSNTSSTCFRTEPAFAFALALDFAHLRSDVFGGVAPAHGSALGVPQGKGLKEVAGLEIRFECVLSQYVPDALPNVPGAFNDVCCCVDNSGTFVDSESLRF